MKSEEASCPATPRAPKAPIPGAICAPATKEATRPRTTRSAQAAGR